MSHPQRSTRTQYSSPPLIILIIFKLKAAIQNAKSLEEVQRLERSLSKGKLPKQGTDGAEDRMETSEGESTPHQS